MTSLFSKPKIPKPTPTPPAPTVDDARERIEESRTRRHRIGRTATKVVGQESAVATAARALTGN